MAKCEISQRAAILARLKQGKKISPLQALRDFGCLRLAAVIYRLREQGHVIVTDWRHQGESRYAVYRLQAPEEDS